jgi:hypothetical protein
MEQLKDISRRADGTLSNAPPPPKLGESSKTAFQALAFGEEFEQAYFSSLLQNVTDGVPGYRHHGRFTKAELVKVLETVVAVSFQPSFVIHSLTWPTARRASRHQRDQRPEALQRSRADALQIPLPHE